MDTTVTAPIVYEPAVKDSGHAILSPAWRCRSMLEALGWARQARIPFCPYVAAKALR